MHLKKCPNCKSEHQSDTISFCPKCGHKLQTVEISHSPSGSDDDNLDFVVTEAHEDSRDFVGGVKTKKPEDDLGLQATAELVQPEAETGSQTPSGSQIAEPSDEGLIGDTAPPPPPTIDHSLNNTAAPDNPFTAPLPNTGSTSQVQKLSNEEIKSIKDDMFKRSDEYLSDQEKFNLLKSIDGQQANGNKPPTDESVAPFGNTPIVPPEKAGPPKPATDTRNDLPRPKISKRARGIAYFAGNLIQIKGGQELHEHDDLVINDRYYVLRKKKVSNRMLLATLAPLAALFIFWIGTYFTADSTGGTGRIVGVVLDGAGQPYLKGAIVRLPELGEVCKANPQGMFQTDQIKTGSHKVELVVDGAVAGWDYATVVPGKITTVTLKSSDQPPSSPANVRSQTPQPTTAQSEPAQPIRSEPAVKMPAKTELAKKPQKASTKSTSKTKSAKLRLAANIEGARLTINGSVLGAGNLTYSKLKAGKHSYTVSSDGYQTVSGNIELRAGKTTDLKVTLEPLSTAQKEETFSEEHFYYSGTNALRTGEYDAAIADFTEAINLKPSYAAAYFSRAKAFANIRDKKSACDDYISAAERFRFNREHNQAITAYNRAIDLNPKSIPALLGRASLYLARGEEIPAIADYETIIKLDKRNFQAYYGLGEARFGQGYYKKAIKYFKDARSLDQKDPSVYQFLMLSYMAADNVKQVRKTYDRFKKIASQEDIDRMRSDKRFSAVLRVIDE